MRNHFNPCVLPDGHLYGINGTTHGPTKLTCIEMATGDVKWAEPGFGSGALITAVSTPINAAGDVVCAELASLASNMTP